MNRAGIYIHIPFCRSRCSYCDFATGAYDGALAERYVGALAREMRRLRAPPKGHAGSRHHLLRRRHAFAAHARAGRARARRRARAFSRRRRRGGDDGDEPRHGHAASTCASSARLGVNRASFGAQTFDDRELRRLGPHAHGRRRAPHARGSCATPDSTTSASISSPASPSRRSTAGRAIWTRRSRSVPNISRSICSKSTRARRSPNRSRRGFAAPDADVAAEMYRLMVERTRAAGYEQYEISNFCLPGYESRHNTEILDGRALLRLRLLGPFFRRTHARAGRTSATRARYVELIEEQGAAPSSSAPSWTSARRAPKRSFSACACCARRRPRRAPRALPARRARRLRRRPRALQRGRTHRTRRRRAPADARRRAALQRSLRGFCLKGAVAVAVSQ